MGGALATLHPDHQILIGDPSACMFMPFSGRPFSVVDVEAGYCGLPSTHLAIGNIHSAGLCPDHAAHVKRCAGCRRVVIFVEPWFFSISGAA